MSTLKVITNNHARQLVYGYELTEAQKADFDYLDAEELETHDFFVYKGQVYDPCEFERIDKGRFPKLANWDGIHGDSFFSGILFRWEDTDAVVVGWYYC